jgi:predicted amidophosphoribosyltransferase
MRDAFSVDRPAVFYGKSVLLIDDVYTTGVTVNECARVLKKAGAKSVEVLVLAHGS